MILRLKLYQFSLKVWIYALPILAFRLGWWAWVMVSLTLKRPTLYSPQGHLSHMLFGTLAWALVAEHYRVTSFDELFRERTGIRAAGAACIAISGILLATLYFSRNNVYPRGLLVCDILFLLLLTLVVHAGFRILYRSNAHLAKPSRLLVVGADEFASNAVSRLQRLSFAPAQIAGYVRLPGQDVCVAGHRIYELAQLEMLNSVHEMDEAVIAIHPAQFPQIPEIIRTLNHLCLPLRAIVDLGEGIVVRERLFQLGNLQMLDLTVTPADSLDYALFKRAFDIFFSVAVLFLAAPLLALIAILIKLTSKGPVLFSQERVGLNGKVFRMYKFRTMRTSATGESDTRWTEEGDPRRTPFGILLRKTSLDELPQFLNVLQGDMSVVGPRPERSYFVDKFLREVNRYNNRHTLKVGITGWAQVNGWRGDSSIEKRIEYDLYYLQNWTFAFDLQIIAMTVFMGLSNRNAY